MGIGPGSYEGMTGAAVAALEKSDVIVGYTVYIDLVKDHFAGKSFLTTPMRKEVDRCVMAFDEAMNGQTVSMICSGDAGVYGMAGLMYEVGANYPDVDIEVVAGVTAATGGAAVLGAPLIHDFCLISLSDLLTPWEKIEKRLLLASEADFVICLYNPSSHKRHDYLKKACELMLQHKSPDTVCGIVKNIGREGESSQIMTLDELKEAAAKIGFPCVVKPLMSSSGKGQSLVKSADELEHAWEYGCSGSRGDIRELIIEEFIKFDSEITLLTVTQKNGPTLFCPPIGHVQKGGDYRESFQPAHIDPAHLKEAEEMAEKVTRALTGAGLWGVEFFLSHENGVYFSELSPRPHDTGMVTLAGTQNLNEFELHLRAVLGLPIPGIKQERIGASAVILSPIASQERPQYRGMEEVTKEEDTYLRIFGKPFTRVNRRMGVVLCYAPLNSDLDALRDKAKRIAEKVEVY